MHTNKGTYLCQENVIVIPKTRIKDPENYISIFGLKLIYKARKQS